MTRDSDDLRELYYEFGRAAEIAQLMETEAGNLALVYSTMLVDTSKITEEQRGFFRSLIQDINARTFGNLFREIKEMVAMDDRFLATVEEALNKRNYLMHKFFREHNFAIYSVEGQLCMLTELRETQETFNRAHATLTAMTKSLSQSLPKLKGHVILSDQMAHSLMADGKRVGML
jgi:hypothetical protein